MADVLGTGPLMTVAEVAEAMRVSKMTVYRLVHAGEMGSVRIGRSYRIPESALEQYIASTNPQEPPPAPTDKGTAAGPD
ncbi:helix-turn-helix domain-containing protein [Arthrobacter sp. H41]|uniref:helix-turn-helix domain-containing protein n=1 Tax=Arthrobacter sp. H41 TaxID=1312978 RepID=UPI0004B2F9FF|nr:helix-turn-helix domain-containing protein [Arthrobacter sp. H41]